MFYASISRKTVFTMAESDGPARHPMLPQQIQRAGRQRQVTIFGSLTTMDMHGSASRINVADLQVESFVQPQPERIQSPEKHGHAFGRAGIDNGMHLFDGDHFRQRPGALHLELFERDPVARAS